MEDLGESADEVGVLAEESGPPDAASGGKGGTLFPRVLLSCNKHFELVVMNVRKSVLVCALSLPNRVQVLTKVHWSLQNKRFFSYFRGFLVKGYILRY
jgi:hypothetical protein